MSDMGFMNYSIQISCHPEFISGSNQQTRRNLNEKIKIIEYAKCSTRQERKNHYAKRFKTKFESWQDAETSSA